MKESKVISDFTLFNDILDEIATKEREEENFFSDNGADESNNEPNNLHILTKKKNDEIKKENGEKTTDFTVSSGIISPMPVKNSSYSERWEDEASSNTESEFSETHENNVRREDSYTSSNGYDQVESESGDLNGSNNSRTSSSSSNVKYESENLFTEQNSMDSSSENKDKDDHSQFMLRYNNFCEFLEEVKQKNKNLSNESFSIEVKKKEQFKNFNKKEIKTRKKDKKKCLKKKKDRNCNCKCCKNYEDQFINMKLRDIFQDEYINDPNEESIVTFKRSERAKRKFKKSKSMPSLTDANLNQKKRLDSRLRDSSNPASLSWLNEKDKIEKEKKRQELRQRRLQRKVQKQNLLQREKLAQLSIAKVQNWMQEKKVLEEKNKHIYPAFEEERVKLIKLEKECDRSFQSSKQSERNVSSSRSDSSVQDKKLVRFSSAKHKTFKDVGFYTYFINRPGNPIGYMSIDAFVNSIINEAIVELERAARVKSARFKQRPNTAAVSKQKNPQLFEKRIPSAPLKTKNAVTRSLKSGHATNRPVWRMTTPGFSRTFEDWLAGKKDLDRMKARKKITTHYYDELEKQILKREYERRKTEQIINRRRVQSSHPCTRLISTNFYTKQQGF